MRNNKLKRQLQLKQKLISKGNRKPSNGEGRDGDLTVRFVQGQGMFLFYKWAGKWYSSRMKQYSSRTSELKEPVKLPIGKTAAKVGELTFKDGTVHLNKAKGKKSRVIAYDVVSGDNIADASEIDFSRSSTTGMSADNAGTSDLRIINKTGHASFHIKTESSTHDPFIILSHLSAGETVDLKQWVIGMDNSASDKLKICSKSAGTEPLTPSTSTAGNIKLEINTDGDVDIKQGSLTIADLSTDNTLTNILVETSGLVKKRTVSSLSIPTNFITNDAADIMAVSDFGANAALKIDADQPATTGAENSVGLWIDYDRIVAASGTAAHNDIGIDLDVNAASLGTSFVTGMDIDVVGATSGTHTAYGINLSVTGADKNIGMVINNGTGGAHLQLVTAADPNDYATFTVADTGDLTIATFGDGITDSDLTLDVDGDIIMDAGGGNVTISSADVGIDATKKLYFDGGGDTYIEETSADVLSFVVGGQTFLTMTESSTDIATVGVGFHVPALKRIGFDGGLIGTYIAESADDVMTICVGADEMVILDEANDKISLSATNWVAGTVSGTTVTEFSAANSAYAGMVLGYTRLQGDLTNQSVFEIQNAITVEDDTHKVTFKTPPSELVEIEATFTMNIATTSTMITAGLSDADASTGYNSIGVEYEYDYLGVTLSDGEMDDGIYSCKWVLPAAELAAVGSSNTFWIGFGTAGSTKTCYLTYGVRASHGIATAPFIIKATALPNHIYDGL